MGGGVVEVVRLCKDFWGSWVGALSRFVVFAWCCFFFFFQAEDGIRDDLVTGVQTCALPISARRASAAICASSTKAMGTATARNCSAIRRSVERRITSSRRRAPLAPANDWRSEERRVGKEYRCRGGAHHLKTKEIYAIGIREK